jgi:hypothetical protein
VTQETTSLQQLRQALVALRQDLETPESALIEVEDQALGEGGEGGAGSQDHQVVSTFTDGS